jgi:hypothetical protein
MCLKLIDTVRHRNHQRFRNAILFHLGGLDLYPRPTSPYTIS